MEWLWIAIAVVVVLAIVAVLVPLMVRRRKTKELKEGFGSEYDHALEERGTRKEAEEDLVERRERRSQLDIRALDPHVRDHYADEWQTVQRRFVDEPTQAVADAQRLVTDVMQRRGYPTDDFEQRAADVSVDHPHVVENYREAHAIASASERREVSTEDQRKALVHYRALFDELLETSPSEDRQEVAR